TRNSPWAGPIHRGSRHIEDRGTGCNRLRTETHQARSTRQDQANPPKKRGARYSCASVPLPITQKSAGYSVHGILEALARLETGDIGCGNGDLFVGTWIAPGSRRSVLDGEGSESGE